MSRSSISSGVGGLCAPSVLLSLAIWGALFVLPSAATSGGAAITLIAELPAGFQLLNPTSNGTIYMSASVKGQLRIQCNCLGESQVDVLFNSEMILTNRSCSPIPIAILPTIYSGIGICRFRFSNNTVVELSRTLQVIDVANVTAPAVQYGVLHMPFRLHCEASSQFSSITTVKWINSTQNTITGSFSSVDFQDEGQYKCEIFIAAVNVRTTRMVELVVLMAPVISHPPPPYLSHFTANSNENLTVHFMSKYSSETRVTWYKNNQLLPNSAWVTSYEGINGQTSAHFQPIRRSDAGSYIAVITNTNPLINSTLNTVQATLQVTVSIKPEAPINLDYEQGSQRLTWSYPALTADGTVEQQLVIITHHNGIIVLRHPMDDASRSMELPGLVPGTSYTATVTSFNQDGNKTSGVLRFQTAHSAPSVRSVEVRRVGNDTLVVTAFLNYIGANIITGFIVSYRSIGTDEWSESRHVPAQPGASTLEWRAVLTEKQFVQLKSMLELQVSILNDFSNTSIIYREHVDVPGPPKFVSVVMSDYNSLTLRVTLSEDGATPLLFMEVYLKSDHHGNQTSNVSTDSVLLQPGNDVDVVVGNLEEGTEYSVGVAIYNYGGRGPTSQSTRGKTLTRPPIPVYGIALLVVAMGILLVVMVIVVIFAFKRHSERKKNLRAYDVSKNGGSSTLSPSHPVLHIHKGEKTNVPTSPSPPTPSTATSVISPTLSPPAFCPPPDLSRQHSTTDSRVLIASGHTHSPFKFDSGSSRSTSVTHDDSLESATPRYILTFPHSGEITPQIEHALDRMEGLRDHTPNLGGHVPNMDTPPRHTLRKETLRDHNLRMEQDHTSNLRDHTSNLRDHTPYGPVISHDMLPSSGSSRSRLGSASTSRSRLTAGSGLASSSSPYLHAQSSYSVNTTATRLTSDTLSTQDGLLFARIETNRTDV